MQGGYIMRFLAAGFFLISLVAAALGVSGLAAGYFEIEKILFIVFLALALLTVLFGKSPIQPDAVSVSPVGALRITARSRQ